MSRQQESNLGHPLYNVAECIKQRVPGEQHDLWALYRDSQVLGLTLALLAEPYSQEVVDVVVGTETRGVLLAGLVARELGVGVVPARKQPSYLPGEVVSTRSLPDWQGNEFEFAIQRHAILPGQRVLVVDDWYTTGSQGRAVVALLRELGAIPVGTSVIVEDGVAANYEGLPGFNALLHWSVRDEQFSVGHTSASSN